MSLKLRATNTRNIDSQVNDYYATDPKAIDELLRFENFNHNILEPCVGGGHLANRLEEYGYSVKAFDIVDRGYPNTIIKNALDIEENSFDIVTNHPYRNAKEIIEHLIEVSDKGVKIAFFLKLTFLESVKRYEFFKKYPPKRIYVFSYRINCARNGDFEKYKNDKAVAYCWYIWEVGNYGKTYIDWINKKVGD